MDTSKLKTSFLIKIEVAFNFIAAFFATMSQYEVEKSINSVFTKLLLKMNTHINIINKLLYCVQFLLKRSNAFF